GSAGARHARLPRRRRRAGGLDGGHLPGPLRAALPRGRCGGSPGRLDSREPQHPLLRRRHPGAGHPGAPARPRRAVRDPRPGGHGDRIAKDAERLRGGGGGKGWWRAPDRGPARAARHGFGRCRARPARPAGRGAARAGAVLPDLRRLRSPRQPDRGDRPRRARGRRGRLHRPHLLARRDAAHLGPAYGRPGARAAPAPGRARGEDRGAAGRGARRAGRPDRGDPHRGRAGTPVRRALFGAGSQVPHEPRPRPRRGPRPRGRAARGLAQPDLGEGPLRGRRRRPRPGPDRGGHGPRRRRGDPHPQPLRTADGGGAGRRHGAEPGRL
ncbi:MAG: Thioredoxin reductase, partial [uncultured Acetobacteraceae bacterium]